MKKSFVRDKKVSDEEYWKQYTPSKDEEGFEGMQNHDIDLDVICNPVNRSIQTR